MVIGPGNRMFLEVASMVVSWCIMAFLPSALYSHLESRNIYYAR